jgi:hypothetical protein
MWEAGKQQIFTEVAPQVVVDTLSITWTFQQLHKTKPAW